MTSKSKVKGIIEAKKQMAKLKEEKENLIWNGSLSKPSNRYKPHEKYPHVMKSIKSVQQKRDIKRLNQINKEQDRLLGI